MAGFPFFSKTPLFRKVYWGNPSIPKPPHSERTQSERKRRLRIYPFFLCGFKWIMWLINCKTSLLHINDIMLIMLQLDKWLCWTEIIMLNIRNCMKIAPMRYTDLRAYSDTAWYGFWAKECLFSPPVCCQQERAAGSRLGEVGLSQSSAGLCKCGWKWGFLHHG